MKMFEQTGPDVGTNDVTGTVTPGQGKYESLLVLLCEYICKTQHGDDKL
jgi:hypothetical protein